MRSSVGTGRGSVAPPRSAASRSRLTTDPPVLRLAAAERTRFAPAPTGHLHLGHVANALWVWGGARLTGAEVLLRIEDHDRQRSRSAFADALLADLAWLGFRADHGPLRQSDSGALAAYAAALEGLRASGRVYRCGCTRGTFASWAREHGRPWTGPGCPGACRQRGLTDDAGTSLRVSLDAGASAGAQSRARGDAADEAGAQPEGRPGAAGDGSGHEAWDDLRLGARSGDPSATGDLVARDRKGNWTYGFAVVVDDLRQRVDLVIRGEDLLAETPRQIRLGRLLGRAAPARFLHHPLIRKAGGAKLSKSDGDHGVRELRAAGWRPDRVRAEAARLADVPDEVVTAAT